MTLLDRLVTVGSVVTTLTSLTHALRGLLDVLSRHGDAVRRPAAYTTQSLDLHLDLADPAGERAVLTRRQRLWLRQPGPVVLWELVWGDGEQLARYRASGAQRLGVAAAGSRQIVVLSLDDRSGRGHKVVVTSRRHIRGGFRRSEEYCELLVPGHIDWAALTVLFPPERPPLSHAPAGHAPGRGADPT